MHAPLHIDENVSYLLTYKMIPPYLPTVNLLFFINSQFQRLLFTVLPIHSSGFNKIVFQKGYLREIMSRAEGLALPFGEYRVHRRCVRWYLHWVLSEVLPSLVRKYTCPLGEVLSNLVGIVLLCLCTITHATKRKRARLEIILSNSERPAREKRFSFFCSPLIGLNLRKKRRIPL